MEITQDIVNKRTKLFLRLFGFVTLSLLVVFIAFIALSLASGNVPRWSWFLYELFFPPVIPGIVIYVLFSLWIGALIAKMAWKKGRSWNAFFALSLFFPVIAWIIAAVVSTDQATAISGTKKCPKCAELIKQEATLCKHCGSEV